MAAEYVQIQCSPSVALAAFVLFPSFFVLSLHGWRCFGYADTDRDDTGTIQRRFLSSVLTCIVSGLMVYALAIPSAEPYDLRRLTYAEVFGLQMENLVPACLCCVGATAILFVGPIVQHLVASRHGGSFCPMMTESRWILVRNLVMAPLTEELVFRACLVRLWVAAGFDDCVIIFLSPMCFALGHAHHFLELTRRSRAADPNYNWIQDADSIPREQVKRACLQVLFQMFYTCLFGIYASFLLLRTGSTIAVILAHSFCNHQGFPDVSFLTSKDHRLYERRCPLAVVYIFGIVLFGAALGPWTDGFASPFAANTKASDTA